MQRLALLLLLFGFCRAGPVPVPQVLEFDSEDSRRVLGSSVVTSVSVIMDLGNGTKAFFADAAGRPVPRPPALSPVGSPVELLSPDRYEFYTFDEFGDLVRRYMTLDQIQSIIASGDGEVRPLPGLLEDYRPSTGPADVGDVIASVQNVLRGAMNASEEPPTRRPPPPPRPTSPSHTPSVAKPAKPLPPLQTATTRPLTTVSVETPTPPVIQLTTDSISSSTLSSTKPRPITAPVNTTTLSEIISASTQSDADSSKTESLGQQITTTTLPTSPVTEISVEITSSEVNETSNGNVPNSSNTSISETVDSESVQSAVSTESSVQTEQSSTTATAVSDSSSTIQTSTSVSNDTSSSETATVSSTQLVYNESSTVPTAQSDSVQNETSKNVSASVESSSSNQQETQTSSSMENTIDSQSYEESSLETSTELSTSEKKNETTSTEKSDTTEYVTEKVSVQTDISSVDASVQNGSDKFEPENPPTRRPPPPPRPTKRPEHMHKTTTSPSQTPSVAKPAKPLPPLQTATIPPPTTVSAETVTPPVIQLTTGNISSTRLPSTTSSSSSATEEIASFESNLNAVSNTNYSVTDTLDTEVSQTNSGSNTTEGENSSIIMEEILESSLGSTSQDSVEASSTTLQPENFTSSTANVSISQYSAETSSETYSTEISILTQPTESSNNEFNETISQGSNDTGNAPSTSEDGIIQTTQSYDISVSETVSQKVEENNDTRNDVTTTLPMDSYLPQELIDSLSSVMSQVSEDNDQQNLSDLKFSSENITATTLMPEITETTTILAVSEKLAVDSSSPLENGVDDDTTTVTIEAEQTTISANNDIQETQTPLLSEEISVQTDEPSVNATVQNGNDKFEPEKPPTRRPPPPPPPPPHRHTKRPEHMHKTTASPSVVNITENTKQEEILQFGTITQESSTNYIGGSKAETTTLSIKSDENDSIQPTTVTSESSGNESLNIFLKSGNVNTSTEELYTLTTSEQSFERTTTLAAEAEEQSNVITTISPLDSNSEGDIKILTTESSTGDIEITTTVSSKSSDYITAVQDEKYSETEAQPEQTTSFSVDLPQTTEIDSILKLITKGETRISLIEEPSYTANETQSVLSAVYNNDTSNETTENVSLTEAETTTFSTQPVLQETDMSNITKDETSEAISPESKEDSTTAYSVSAQDEIYTNTTAIYSTSTAHPENDTLEAEIETTYLSGTKDENVVSEYDASVKESSQTLNGTGNYNSSTFTSSSESSTNGQFVESNNGTAEQTSAVNGNYTSQANVDTDNSSASYPVQATDVSSTTDNPTEQPALKTDLQNGYETSIYGSGSNASGVPQNYTSESSVDESGVSVDITTTEASKVDASSQTTKTDVSSNSDVPVQETEETTSKESEVSGSAGASTEGSTPASASPVSSTAPEAEEPGENALKDGVDTPAPVDLRPSQNEHLGLEATTASLERGVRRFTDLCNELALRLWAAVAARGATSARSLVMSPFAVTSLLAMVFLGARGPTSAEMNDLLRLDDMVTFNPHLIFRNITETLVHGRTPGIASVAFVRQLYSDKNKGKILDFYKDRAQQFYDGHVEEANFRVIGDLVRRRTNLLVKRQTRGRVPEFLRGPGVALRPPLAAFSANVLQTDCSDAGMEGRDGEMYFTVTPSPRERRLIPVPAAVWRQGVYAGYDPQIDATVAALGVDSAVSLIFVSPGQQGNVAPGDGLPQLERRLLTPPAWSRLLRSLLPRPGLELQVPRFSHRSLLNATGALQRLGLRDLLTPGRADLRGLDGLGDLYLADVLAATALTTCAGERGHAEAYPARAARLLDADLSDLPLALRPRQARRPLAPARLRYDKPFFYAVRHNPTGVILHMGRFNPRLQ